MKHATVILNSKATWTPIPMEKLQRIIKSSAYYNYKYYKSMLIAGSRIL